MPPRSKPTIPAVRLGRRLRRLREQAGLSQEVAAKALHYDQSKLSRIENGQVPDYHALCAMLDRYGLVVGEWQDTLDLHEKAKAPGWWRGFGLDDNTLISLEHEASVVRDYMLGYVPGLLQTEDYIRAIWAASGRASKHMLDNIVHARLRRQRRLIDDKPVDFRCIIDASVFFRQLTDPAIMRAQLDHIGVMAKLPNVSVRILDESVGSHVGLVGSFTLLGFADLEHHEVVFVEYTAGQLRFEEPEVVVRCDLTFRELTALALSEDETSAWMAERSTRL